MQICHFKYSAVTGWTVALKLQISNQPRKHTLPGADVSICIQVLQKSWHKPAGDNDDILRDVGHLFDGQVAHPPQGLLEEKERA